MVYSSPRPLPSDHPWDQAYWDFKNKIMPVLEKHGREIGDKAKTGDDKAQKVIGFYKMLVRSFDPMTTILLEKELKEMGYLK